ncbi:hypothetical protein AVEN_208519-1 [Araneus ventricosus]|uniref:Peptidase aspartic putative domain-containing protein n=1 Tax=Araneus ventricosus TaxID=182803 RepID=A0A4Y2E418_ARAVE|nr:hypothetical protein AVEN_208519-1 [Araneus ventricosus]
MKIELEAQRYLKNFKKCVNEYETAFENTSSIDNKLSRNLHPRLPEIELFKFGGDLKDWLTFWNQFKSINENADLSNVDKFHYLMQSTKAKSEAREIVESFPVSDENYTLAIESLTERYGQKDLLIDFNVRDILKLVLDALDQEVICNDISSIRNGSWIHELKYKGIYLTDIHNNSVPIEVQLGADVAGKLFTGGQEELNTDPIAMETKLGWTLMGKIPQSESFKDVNMTVVNILSQEDIPISSLRDLELLGIRGPV